MNSITFLNKITNNLREFIIPKNYKFINKEVSVISCSQIHDSYNIDISLGKSTSHEYTLFSGSKGHFLVVDLNKKYYLNSIRIEATSHDCSLKNFIVFIKESNDEHENWIKINEFVKKKENQNNSESFEIGHFCRQIKFLFADTWGISSGDYILIKKIDFEVGE